MNRQPAMVRALLDRLIPLRSPSDPAGATTPTDDDVAQRRRATSEKGATVLSDVAQHWIGSLPEFVRPRRLSQRHPHVANRLASLWPADADACSDCLERLLLDERGGRVGFAPSVRAEIVRLQRYHAMVLAAARRRR